MLSTNTKNDEKKFRSIFDSSPHGILMSNAKGEIVIVNKQVEEMFGYTTEELLGKKVEILLPEQYRKTHVKKRKQFHDSGASRKMGSGKSLYGLRSDGTQFPLDIELKQMQFDGEEEMLVTIVDLSEQKKVEEALKASEDKFSKSFHFSPDAMSITTLDEGRFVDVNESFLMASGYSREEIIGNTSLELGTWVDPKDRDELLTKLKAQGTVHEIEISARHRSGEIRQIQISADTIEINNQPHLLSVFRDITEEKKLADKIRRLSLSVEYSPATVMITNKDSIIEYVNKKFTELTGYTEEDVIGHHPSILFAEKKSKAAFSDLRKNLMEGKAWREEILNKKKNGELYWAEHTIYPIMDEDGNINYVVSYHEDITERKKQSEQLTYQASHDLLTGLINRREFERRLDRIFATTKLDDSHHVFCFLDLDKFKIINDTCGHVAGDELLRQLGMLLRKLIRKRDTVARLGGDEFGILMEHCLLEKAQQVTENIRAAIEDFQFNWEGETYSIGVSIGMTSITADKQDVIELQKQADEACYAAKDAGGNQVFIYSDNAVFSIGKEVSDNQNIR